MAEPITAVAAAFAKWATAKFITGTGLTSLAGAKAVYAVAYYGAQAVIYAGLAVGMTALAKSQIPDPEGQKVTRKLTRPERYIPIGGPSRMSGAYMFREARGNKYGAVLAICEGRLASINRYYLNDDIVTLTGQGWVVSQPGERYGGKSDLIRISTRLGNPTETRHSILDPFFADLWPTDARGDGIASLAMFCQHRSRASVPRHFPNGEPLPSIVGVPVCYDWRDGSQSRTNPATWKACDNPVVWLVFYEWHYRGMDWGRKIAPVLSALTTEANYCDGTVALAGGGTEKRYTLAGNCPITTEPRAVRDNILSCFDGWYGTDGRGRLVIKAGRYTAPTLTVEAEHILDYNWQAFQREEDAVNELVVGYCSPDDDYSMVPAGIWADESEIIAMGQVRSEGMDLPWVTSRTQAMRLAKRKMIRLGATRRGQITLPLYGLNGLGHRYIRIKNPELKSMANVVVEVLNVEMDLNQARVVLDVVQADPSIDGWVPAEEEGEAPAPIVKPDPEPANQGSARSIRSPSVTYPLSSDHESISIVAFDALGPDGEELVFPAGEITGLSELTRYGVFWRSDIGYVAEASPAPDHMSSGGYYFLGWQSTSDEDGEYPTPETPPPGYGGSDQAQV